MSVRRHVIEYSRAPVINGVIEGVKIIGTKSRNGYDYPEAVLSRAKPLYEGAAVFIFHPTDPEKRRGSRQLVDHFGSLANIRAGGDRKGGFGLFGDLLIKQSHPMAQLVTESAGRKFGLSHNAVVEMNEEETEVVEIIDVNSVDLVDEPATTTTLFEETDVLTLEDLQKDLDAMREEMAKYKTLTEDHHALQEQVKGLTEAQTKTETKDPVKRITALEKVTDGDGETTPIGNTHEDFMGALRGFPVTN